MFSEIDPYERIEWLAINKKTGAIMAYGKPLKDVMRKLENHKGHYYLARGNHETYIPVYKLDI